MARIIVNATMVSFPMGGMKVYDSGRLDYHAWQGALRTSS